ncbi:type III secretion system cytoplasmic ring protein SctQ [uncultured Thiocystis sp.]|uniref:type III secretion system cytoplasmic ring protein SctQ n=1 Tax=uncultured Thiocystis sp. TaxID=1202134 RepID=UPI0025F89EF5|nr:type III secretion system cytoplasmic ring protein SctQ [uncultured Thiocystis sp.]
MRLDLPEGPLVLGLALEPGTMLNASPPAQLIGQELSIRLSGEAGTLWLELAPGVWRHWLYHWIGELALDQLPQALGAAARQAALAPLLDALESLLSIRLEAAVALAAPETLPVAESILRLWPLDVESATPIARLSLDAAASLQLAARLEQKQRPAIDSDTNAERWPDLPITLTPWLGATRLRTRECRALEIGDLLLLPRQVEPQAIPLLLTHRQRTLATAHLAGQCLIIDSLVSATMSEHPIPDPDSDSSPAVIDPDELEIGIDFELGRLQLPLRELRAMQPGYCFELNELDRPRIRLVVGGRLIGHGELVMIEAHLGVRVTELFASPPSA